MLCESMCCCYIVQRYINPSQKKTETSLKYFPLNFFLVFKTWDQNCNGPLGSLILVSCFDMSQYFIIIVETAPTIPTQRLFQSLTALLTEFPSLSYSWLPYTYSFSWQHCPSACMWTYMSFLMYVNVFMLNSHISTQFSVRLVEQLFFCLFR